MTLKLSFLSRCPTHLKNRSNWHLNQDWCETREIFWASDQSSEIVTYQRTSTAHILHTSKSISEDFLRKWPNTRILTNFSAQNGLKIRPLRPIFHTCDLWIYKSSSNKLVDQVWIRWKCNKKIDENLYIDLFGPIWEKRGPKTFHTHTPESTHNAHVNPVSWSHI